MLRSKEIICIGCAVACDLSIYKRPSHTSQKLTELTDQKYRSNSIRCLISMFLDPAYTLYPSYYFCLPEARIEASSSVSIYWKGNQASHLLEEKFTIHSVSLPQHHFLSGLLPWWYPCPKWNRNVLMPVKLIWLREPLTTEDI